MGVSTEASLRREVRAWYVYDWANSAFASTVLTLFLGPYLTAVAKSAAGADGYVYPFGIKVDPRSYWGYLVSLSVLLQVFVLPYVGTVADRFRRKRELLGLLALTGAGATTCLYFVKEGRYLLGGGLFLIANLTFGAAMAVYNSFLPEIAPPEERDAVSSRGWGIGYLGGGLLLLLNLLFLSQAPALGLTEGHAVRICLASAGLWWGLFALIPVTRLRNRGLPSPSVSFVKTLRELRAYPQTLLFLAAYLIYNDAIQTVIAIAGQFGSDELKMPMRQLTMAILMVQFVAFGGAFLFQWLAGRFGAKRSVLGALVVWTGVIGYIYLAVSTATEFFVMAGLVGVVMGGSQALSRAIYSQMIPAGKEAEYFSIYEISDKGTSWLGPLVFGLALQHSGSYRTAALTLLVFFFIGFGLLQRVEVRQSGPAPG